MQSVVNRTNTSHIKQKITHTLTAVKWQKKTIHKYNTPTNELQTNIEANGTCGVKNNECQPKRF